MLSFDWPRLDDPIEYDPLRVYDALGRNQPRRLGFMETVVRPFPWLLAMFTGRVPDEMVATIGDGVVEVPCTCKATTVVPYNVATECEGGCGRYFWHIGPNVRVGYDPERHTAPNG